MDGEKIESVEQLQEILARGELVQCCWKGKHPMHTVPGTVIAAKEDRVLVSHWSADWYAFDGHWYEFRYYPKATINR